MAFHLEEAKPEDFPELIRCLWESYETPHQQFFRLYCPIIGSGPTAREDSLKACTERMLSYHLEDSTSYWQKVIDDPSGKIVAGALWKICEKNPFENGFHAEIADWWPEGGEREFITATIKKHEVARSYFARRPQIYLNIIFVHPGHRRKAVGSMIMRWGLQKADEMGVEFWLDATVRGKPLYESHGFGSVLKNVLTVDNSGANEGWKRLDRVMNEDPMTMWVMWRPIGGVFEVDEKGERVRPWEKEEGWVESEGYELLKSQKI